MRKPSDGETLLDLRGLRCPLPALRTEKALSAAAPGAWLVVLADDPLAGLDLPHLCRQRGDEFLSSEDLGTHRRFTLRKAEGGLSPA